MATSQDSRDEDTPTPAPTATSGHATPGARLAADADADTDKDVKHEPPSDAFIEDVVNTSEPVREDGAEDDSIPVQLKTLPEALLKEAHGAVLKAPTDAGVDVVCAEDSAEGATPKDDSSERTKEETENAANCAVVVVDVPKASNGPSKLCEVVPKIIKVSNDVDKVIEDVPEIIDEVSKVNNDVNNAIEVSVDVEKMFDDVSKIAEVTENADKVTEGVPKLIEDFPIAIADVPKVSDDVKKEIEACEDVPKVIETMIVVPETRCEIEAEVVVVKVEKAAATCKKEAGKTQIMEGAPSKARTKRRLPWNDMPLADEGPDPEAAFYLGLAATIRDNLDLHLDGRLDPAAPAAPATSDAADPAKLEVAVGGGEQATCIPVPRADAEEPREPSPTTSRFAVAKKFTAKRRGERSKRPTIRGLSFLDITTQLVVERKRVETAERLAPPRTPLSTRPATLLTTLGATDAMGTLKLRRTPNPGLPPPEPARVRPPPPPRPPPPTANLSPRKLSLRQRSTESEEGAKDTRVGDVTLLANGERPAFIEDQGTDTDPDPETAVVPAEAGVSVESSNTAARHDAEPRGSAFSGDWVRPRTYVCAACNAPFADVYDLQEHKWGMHPNAWVCHYEFYDAHLSRTPADTARMSLELYKRFLRPQGVLAAATALRDDQMQCTKCQRTFAILPEFHRHILDCGGDTTWMSTMVAASPGGVGARNRSRKWRPFGARRRRGNGGGRGRRGMKRNIRGTPGKSPGLRQRSRATDAESIQRMIANLPAKRSTRRAINFQEDIKTRSQATISSNRLLRKRYKVAFTSSVPRQSDKSEAPAARRHSAVTQLVNAALKFPRRPQPSPAPKTQQKPAKASSKVTTKFVALPVTKANSKPTSTTKTVSAKSVSAKALLKTAKKVTTRSKPTPKTISHAAKTGPKVVKTVVVKKVLGVVKKVPLVGKKVAVLVKRVSVPTKGLSSPAKVVVVKTVKVAAGGKSVSKVAASKRAPPTQAVATKPAPIAASTQSTSSTGEILRAMRRAMMESEPAAVAARNVRKTAEPATEPTPSSSDEPVIVCSHCAGSYTNRTAYMRHRKACVGASPLKDTPPEAPPPRVPCDGCGVLLANIKSRDRHLKRCPVLGPRLAAKQHVVPSKGQAGAKNSAVRRILTATKANKAANSVTITAKVGPVVPKPAKGMSPAIKTAKLAIPAAQSARLAITSPKLSKLTVPTTKTLKLAEKSSSKTAKLVVPSPKGLKLTVPSPKTGSKPGQPAALVSGKLSPEGECATCGKHFVYRARLAAHRAICRPAVGRRPREVPRRARKAPLSARGDDDVPLARLFRVGPRISPRRDGRDMPLLEPIGGVDLAPPAAECPVLSPFSDVAEEDTVETERKAEASARVQKAKKRSTAGMTPPLLPADRDAGEKPRAEIADGLKARAPKTGKSRLLAPRRPETGELKRRSARVARTQTASPGDSASSRDSGVFVDQESDTADAGKPLNGRLKPSEPPRCTQDAVQDVVVKVDVCNFVDLVHGKLVTTSSQIGSKAKWLEGKMGQKVLVRVKPVDAENRIEKDASTKQATEEVIIVAEVIRSKCIGNKTNACQEKEEKLAAEVSEDEAIEIDRIEAEETGSDLIKESSVVVDLDGGSSDQEETFGANQVKESTRDLASQGSNVVAEAVQSDVEVVEVSPKGFSTDSAEIAQGPMGAGKTGGKSEERRRSGSAMHQRSGGCRSPAKRRVSWEGEAVGKRLRLALEYGIRQIDDDVVAVARLSPQPQGDVDSLVRAVVRDGNLSNDDVGTDFDIFATDPALLGPDDRSMPIADRTDSPIEPSMLLGGNSGPVDAVALPVALPEVESKVLARHAETPSGFDPLPAKLATLDDDKPASIACETQGDGPLLNVPDESLLVTSEADSISIKANTTDRVQQNISIVVETISPTTKNNTSTEDSTVMTKNTNLLAVDQTQRKEKTSVLTANFVSITMGTEPISMELPTMEVIQVETLSDKEPSKEDSEAGSKDHRAEPKKSTKKSAPSALVKKDSQLSTEILELSLKRHAPAELVTDNFQPSLGEPEPSTEESQTSTEEPVATKLVIKKPEPSTKKLLPPTEESQTSTEEPVASKLVIKKLETSTKKLLPSTIEPHTSTEEPVAAKLVIKELETSTKKLLPSTIEPHTSTEEPVATKLVIKELETSTKKLLPSTIEPHITTEEPVATKLVMKKLETSTKKLLPSTIEPHTSTEEPVATKLVIKELETSTKKLLPSSIEPHTSTEEPVATKLVMKKLETSTKKLLPSTIEPHTSTEEPVATKLVIKELETSTKKLLPSTIEPHTSTEEPVATKLVIKELETSTKKLLPSTIEPHTSTEEPVATKLVIKELETSTKKLLPSTIEPHTSTEEPVAAKLVIKKLETSTKKLLPSTIEPHTSTEEPVAAKLVIKEPEPSTKKLLPSTIEPHITTEEPVAAKLVIKVPEPSTKKLLPSTIEPHTSTEEPVATKLVIKKLETSTKKLLPSTIEPHTSTEEPVATKLVIKKLETSTKKLLPSTIEPHTSTEEPVAAKLVIKEPEPIKKPSTAPLNSSKKILAPTELVINDPKPSFCKPGLTAEQPAIMEPQISKIKLATNESATKEPVPAIKEPVPAIKEPVPAIKEPVPATKEPVPATKEPVPATKEPVPATKEPVPATKEPVPATKEPVPAIKEPVPATKEPVPATKEPVPAIKEPVPATKEPVPATKEPVPAIKEPVPSVKEPVPATKEPVPATKEPVPAIKEPVPAIKEPVPATKEPVPAIKEPVPATKEPVPAIKEPVPATKEPVPATKEPVPAIKEPVPAIKEPVPSVKVPVPATKEPVPAIKEPVPAIKEPVLAVKEPGPALKEPVPPIKEPVPAVKEPVPAVKEPVPALKESVPAVKEPVPAIKESVPAVKEPVPATKEPVPATKEPVPVVKEPVPSVKEPVPSVKEPVPSVKEPVPAVKEPVPAIKEPVPATKEPVPATKEPVPAVKEPVPAIKEPVPATKEPVPAVKEPVPAIKEPVPAIKEPVPAIKEPVPATKEPVPATKAPLLAPKERVFPPNAPETAKRKAPKSKAARETPPKKVAPPKKTPTPGKLREARRTRCALSYEEMVDVSSEDSPDEDAATPVKMPRQAVRTKDQVSKGSLSVRAKDSVKAASPSVESCPAKIVQSRDDDDFPRKRDFPSSVDETHPVEGDGPKIKAEFIEAVAPSPRVKVAHAKAGSLSGKKSREPTIPKVLGGVVSEALPAKPLLAEPKPSWSGRRFSDGDGQCLTSHLSCATCNKHYYSKSTFATHLRSVTHVLRVAQGLANAPQTLASKVQTLQNTTSKVQALPTLTSKVQTLQNTTSKVTALSTSTSKVQALPTTTSKVTALPTLTRKVQALPTLTSKVQALPTLTSKVQALPTFPSEVHVPQMLLEEMETCRVPVEVLRAPREEAYKVYEAASRTEHLLDAELAPPREAALEEAESAARADGRRREEERRATAKDSVAQWLAQQDPLPAPRGKAASVRGVDGAPPAKRRRVKVTARRSSLPLMASSSSSSWAGSPSPASPCDGDRLHPLACDSLANQRPSLEDLVSASRVDGKAPCFSGCNAGSRSRGRRLKATPRRRPSKEASRAKSRILQSVYLKQATLPQILARDLHPATSPAHSPDGPDDHRLAIFDFQEEESQESALDLRFASKQKPLSLVDPFDALLAPPKPTAQVRPMNCQEVEPPRARVGRPPKPRPLDEEPGEEPGPCKNAISQAVVDVSNILVLEPSRRRAPVCYTELWDDLDSDSSLDSTPPADGLSDGPSSEGVAKEGAESSAGSWADYRPSKPMFRDLWEESETEDGDEAANKSSVLCCVFGKARRPDQPS